MLILKLRDAVSLGSVRRCPTGWPAHWRFVWDWRVHSSRRWRAAWWSAVLCLTKRTAYCVQRKADHVVVELALGTPPRIVRALFRPDLAVPRGYRALRVFSPRTVESESLFCHGETMQNCTDTLL